MPFPTTLSDVQDHYAYMKTVLWYLANHWVKPFTDHHCGRREWEFHELSSGAILEQKYLGTMPPPPELRRISHWVPSSERRRRENRGAEWSGGVALLQLTMGSGRASWAPQWGPGRKRILAYFERHRTLVFALACWCITAVAKIFCGQGRGFLGGGGQFPLSRWRTVPNYRY